jgi:hypothetical protein
VKHLLAILLFLTFSWQLIGFFTYFECERLRIRKEIKQRIKESIPDNQLHVLVFSANEMKQLVWHKSDEFQYNNRLYDIVSRRATKTGWELHCISDTQESHLMANLSAETADNMSKSAPNSPLKHVVKIIQAAYTIPANASLLITQWQRNPPRLFHYSSHLSDIHLSVIVPPPRG